jgi:lysozyme
MSGASRKTSAEGLALIQRFEGLRLKAYLCPAGVWTIGYGHTGDVEPHHVITGHQAEVILQLDVERFEQGVERLCTGLTLTQGQFDALVSFSFNVGLAALSRSTLLRRLRAGDTQGAADAFRAWVFAAGKKLPGLVLRREAERARFLAAAAATAAA